jgi:F420-dependent oxidoreductase-like protein
MAIGGGLGGGDLDAMVRNARSLEERGFAFTGVANISGWDAIGALAIVGRETERIELQTAVVPTYPRHPVTMAQQALTTQAAAGGRFTLGIGLSHQVVIENSLGLSFARTASHMREYLSVLMPLLHRERVRFEGEEYRVDSGLDAPDMQPVRCLVAALGPVMLRIAGEMADGTATWMCGPKTLESHISPRIRKAAADAGRPEPTVSAALPIALTSDPAAAREQVSQQLAVYPTLPSYKAMLDIEGIEQAGDIAILGDEETLDLALRRLEEAGVTQFSASVLDVEAGSSERTLDYLQSKLQARKL